METLKNEQNKITQCAIFDGDNSTTRNKFYRIVLNNQFMYLQLSQRISSSIASKISHVYNGIIFCIKLKYLT